MVYTRNSEMCRNCGICASDCSPLINGLMESRGNRSNPDSKACERCGHCYSVCHYGAISITGAVPIVPESTAMRPLFTTISMRRSERRFRTRSLSNETVSALLSAAAQTPSGGNRRTTECTLLYDDESRRRLITVMRDFYFRLARLAKNPPARRLVGALLGKVAGAFLNDDEYRKRFVALVEGIDKGRDPLFYGAPMVMLFHCKELMPTPEEDAVIAAYNVSLAATAMGLGTCFVSMAQKAIEASRKVRRTIGLSGNQRILAVLAVGYPAVRRVRSVVRTPMQATVATATN